MNGTPDSLADPLATPSHHPAKPELAELAQLPERIGRYRVERVLGKGGFGLVYLAHDEQLQRRVAIKVPHRERVSRPEHAEAYLAEARMLAALNHPHIVRVYDVGGTDDFPFFIACEYIAGSTLAQCIKDGPLAWVEAAELVATVAEALHYAHRQGLVHRDVKPGNILLDMDGKPVVVDLGLALREAHAGHGPKFAGTPSYMSPEQARGEGHRVDGRSDIFSLGVVLYQMLAGKLPFKGDSLNDLLQAITNFEPPPPRQYNDDIPKELERICFKTLAKRATDRYSTARDLAEDLRAFLAGPEVLAAATIRKQSAPAPSEVAPPAVAATPAFGNEVTPPATPAPPSSDNQIVKIVPKGLRSFDAHDADFFLELLPGPRDRAGLPDSLRFWKTRIEEKDADHTFAVGLIYGPSGCGKSSLMKAGLLPRLTPDVLPVYIEATARETETRLLNGLRKAVGRIGNPSYAQIALTDMLAALRRGQGLPAGKKVLIILDQFEQWLHARREEQNTELVQALRQCDGARVQCIVMVRDDFWLAVSRFLRELEIPLVEGRNSALADLFDMSHAYKVLAAFGRAFGKLPEFSGDLGKEQKQFLDQAVRGLAQEGKVVCVRLALFAEMMKGKAWTPAALKAAGGAEGVGAAFLEETFSAATAPPEHRYHQKAARAVLKALLPEAGADIKGHMRSRQELLEASSYAKRPRDFDDLMRILDGEVRLITPTDPEGVEIGAPEMPVGHVSDVSDLSESVPPSKGPVGHFSDLSASNQPDSVPDKSETCPTRADRITKYYQLTHDYLVPSLRDWLTRKQKETRRGRAELLLADRAAVWNARQENRQLPSLLQWFSIRFLTRKKTWTPPQCKMMQKATRHHALRGFAVAVLLALIGVGSYEVHGRLQARILRDRLLDATTADVPGIVHDMAPYRAWLNPLLKDAQAQEKTDARKQLHLSLALLPVDASQVEYLHGRLLSAEPAELLVIREQLSSHAPSLTERLWTFVEDLKNDPDQRFHAACALAKFDPDSPRWEGVNKDIAEQLLAQKAFAIAQWSESLKPIGKLLLPRLAEMIADEKRPDAEVSLIASVFASYAATAPTAYARLEERLAEQSDRNGGEDARVAWAKKQSRLGVALLLMGRGEKVWPLLAHSPDPTLRSYLVHRLAPLGAAAKEIAKRLDAEPDLTIRRALILSLGEFGDRAFSPDERAALIEKLKQTHSAADPGLRAASEWLLGQWKLDEWLKRDADAWKNDRERREQRLQSVRQQPADRAASAPGVGPQAPGVIGQAQWYVTSQGQTMVVLPGPVEFAMGSPETETRRFPDEGPLHRKRIGRTFAIAAKPVTIEQFRLFRNAHKYMENYAPRRDCPVIETSWYDAASYCNWLSEQEQIQPAQWCYETDKQGGVVKLKEHYLSLSGYRLPTEAEWEYACRARSAESRYYGAGQEFLAKYAWFFVNSNNHTWPVGSLKPNDFGLFDMHGNIWNWCQERHLNYPEAKTNEVAEDKEDILTIDPAAGRVLRGGSFSVTASYARSAYRLNSQPVLRGLNFGFRPARTFR